MNQPFFNGSIEAFQVGELSRGGDYHLNRTKIA